MLKDTCGVDPLFIYHFLIAISACLGLWVACVFSRLHDNQKHFTITLEKYARGLGDGGLEAYDCLFREHDPYKDMPRGDFHRWKDGWAVHAKPTDVSE